MKLGLYTISYQGLFYAGDFVPLKELIPKIAEFGYDGISISGKRPHGSPLDLGDKACNEIKELADSSGIELVALDTYSNFVDPVTEHREAQLIWLRELIRLANKLNIKIVKIFPGWVGTTLRNGKGEYNTLWKLLLPYASANERWNWTKECITESAKWAQEYGVVLALQNHGLPFRLGYEDALEMIKEIDSENLKMCLDIGLGCMNEAQQTDEYITEAVQKCRDYIVYSHFNGHFRETATGDIIQERYDVPRFTQPGGSIMNYPRFVQELRRIGYSDYIAFEVCGNVQRNHQLQGIRELDRLVKAALAYMRKLLPVA